MRICSLDPALGGGNAMVAAEMGESLVVLDARVDYGLARTEQQLELIATFARAYRPSLFVLEVNAQQKGLGNDERLEVMAALYGFRVVAHRTGWNKNHDAVFSVASMDHDFRDGKIRIPFGDDYSRGRMTPLLEQLRSWRPDVPAKRLTQDLVMALWFCWLQWAAIRRRDEAPVAPVAHRPSWAAQASRMRPRPLLASRRG